MKCKYIFEVELVNYLNRFINHENLYEIYKDNSKIEDFKSKDRKGGHLYDDNQQEISSFIIHNKSNDYNSHSCNYIEFIFNSSNDN